MQNIEYFCEVSPKELARKLQEYVEQGNVIELMFRCSDCSCIVVSHKADKGNF